jgi:hypothetical protein
LPNYRAKNNHVLLLFVALNVAFRARCWSKKKQGSQEALQYNISKKGGREYLANSRNGATLDSRNDFEGNWTKPFQPMQVNNFRKV